MKQIAVGILAHVDSGKTTLSEGLLYRSGEIRSLGRVDHKNAFLDGHALERERGITIFSKQARLNLPGGMLTLLDTPGHVDFSPETERTLQVLDYAVLVISGAHSVQSHTRTLWRLLKRYNVPVFVFVNKMDLPGPGKDATLAELKAQLDDRCVDFTPGQPADAFEETLAVCDEKLLDEFLAGGVTDDSVRRAIAKRRLFPCYFGSALKLVGVDELLAGLDRYTFEPAYGDEFGAKVYKIAKDDQGARLTYLKVTGGSLRVKDRVACTQNDRAIDEKVDQIRLYSGAKYALADEAAAGTVCAVTGLSATYPGQGLGAEAHSSAPILEPVLTYSVRLPSGGDVHKALTALKKLEEEEPQLHVVLSDGAIQVQLMGEVQLEVLTRLLADRFAIDAAFEPGHIVYRETIAGPVEGVGHYEPLRHYAEVRLYMEPLPRGSGLKFAANCREDDLDRNWQRLILTHLEEKAHLGVLTGSPITDMKITVVGGRAHLKHTEGGDFRQATYRAVRMGLRCATSVLLEPWYDFRLEVPAQSVGRALSDLQRMDGEFAPPDAGVDVAVITGSAPVAALMSYAAEVTGYTRGQGRLTCLPGGYRPCKNQSEAVAAVGYDCDADTDNPADSVFCAHGAGYVVRWDEVERHAHVPSRKKTSDDSARASRYVGRLADDAELMRIFERTYGPVRDRGFEPRRRPVLPERTVSAPPPKPGAEYLLVDGYNIIFAWEELKALARDNIDAARGRLTDILCSYQGYSESEVILVFDAYKVKGGQGSVEKAHNITVVYTREAQTADMYIERAAYVLAKERRVRVATSDRMEQLIILGSGAIRVSAEAFYEEVERALRAVRAVLEHKTPTYKLGEIAGLNDE